MLKKAAVILVVALMSGIFSSLVQPSLTITGPMDPYLNGIFPESSPGVGGSWSLDDAFPELSINSPLRILQMPNSSDLLVLSKLGEVWQVSLEDQEQRLILDIKDRSFKKGESGTVGMALHPQFGNLSQSY